MRHTDGDILHTAPLYITLTELNRQIQETRYASLVNRAFAQTARMESATNRQSRQELLAATRNAHKQLLANVAALQENIKRTSSGP